MTAEQLRKSILQMAVQGKLVPQDPNDEPAHILLERIRAEKERLIKEKKIKKEKNPSTIYRGTDNLYYEKFADGTVRCIEDEIPFEIPESWAWCRLIEVCKYIQRGKSPKYSLIEKIPVIAQKCNQWDGFHINKAKFIEPDSLKSYGEERLLQDNDLMWNSTGLGSLGRIAMYQSVLNPYELAVADSHVTIIRPLKSFVLSRFLYYYFSNPSVQNVIESQADGTTKQKELATATIKNYLIPIPPLHEQRRILDKLDEVLPWIEKYDITHNNIRTLQDRLPARLKKSILQWAVQGKLVPQDESDEPASVLLERIRAEKEELIKQGKLKKDKHESVIFRRDNSYYERLDGVERCIDDEIPFEIPKTWSWARLGDISTYADLKKKIKAQDADPNIWGLDLEDIEKGGRILEIKTVGERRAIGDKTFFVAGNILYSKLRPYLLKTLVAPADGICSSEIVPFGLYGGILPEYVVTVLKSPYVHEQINAAMYGVKMPRVSTETMISLLIPIPPVNEQQYIVNKLEQTLLLSKSL